jgi:predicted ABC-type ATPase
MSVQTVAVKVDSNPNFGVTRVTQSNDPLIQLFVSEENIQTFIVMVREDRINGTTRLKDELKIFFHSLPNVDEHTITQDPLHAILTLMLREDDSIHLRERAAEAYKAKYPNDKQFEAAYFFLKDPTIFIAHLLITGNRWVCVNQENRSFYDEQIAGIFQGTIAFDKGDYLTADELSKIQMHEKGSKFPIVNSLVEKNGGYEVVKWCSSPPMVPTEHRCDDLFLKSRRQVHNQVLMAYTKDLQETSKLIENTYSLLPGQLYIVAVIGPWGAGKSQFIEKKFAQLPTSFSLDVINKKLITQTSNNSDHHFEAMMLTREMLNLISTIPALLIEAAAIDKYRFERMMNRDYAGRNFFIEEIATPSPQDSIDQYKAREGLRQPLVPTDRIEAATQSANDALQYRLERINTVVNRSDVVYRLYCKGNTIAIAKDGKIVITPGCEKVYQTLTSF